MKTVVALNHISQPIYKHDEIPKHIRGDHADPPRTRHSSDRSTLELTRCVYVSSRGKQVIYVHCS